MQRKKNPSLERRNIEMGDDFDKKILHQPRQEKLTKQ
jgi:hypothetical protein